MSSNALEAAKKAPLRQVSSVKHLLMNDAARDQLAAVSARHLNPERMMRVVANAIRTTPKLQDCDPMSFLGGLMQCASLGLEPNTVLGHAYLIPFDNKRKGITEVQVVVGYKGLIDLARRSGHITSIHAGVHYSDDELWEYEEGTEAKLRHRPGPMDGKKQHAYAIAKFKDGGHAYVVLPWAHVMRIRDASQGYQTAIRFGKKDTPWIAHEDAMAKKTAIRALSKYLPLSVEFVDALAVDEQRSDYRAFAFDPSSGTALPAEDDAIDGAAEEVSEPTPQIDERREAQAAQTLMTEPTRQAEAAKPVQRANAKDAQRQEPVAASATIPQEDRPQRQAAPKPAKNWKDLGANILGSVMGGATAEAISSQFGGDMEAMEASAPDEFEKMLRDLDGLRPGLSAALRKSGEPEKKPALSVYDNPAASAYLRDVSEMGVDEAGRFHGEFLDRLSVENPDLLAAIDAEAQRIAG